MARPLDQLIYLASTRDYNSGIYYHDGLAASFSAEVACEAIAGCHREAFRQLLYSPIESLVEQLEGYMETLHTDPVAFIAAWKELQPYRVAIPVDTDPIAVGFLLSNLKIALAILEQRHLPRPTPLPDAWQHPLPAR